MRFGAFVPLGDRPSDAGSAAEMLERQGFDSVWLEEGFSPPNWPNPMMAVPLVAADTKVCRIGVVAVAGLTHPMYLAEESAAADNACGGRLTLALRPARRSESARAGVASSDQGSRFRESISIVTVALRSRPFSVAGKHWTIPAHLEVHAGSAEIEKVILTPPPTQIPLPIWQVAGNRLRVGRGRIMAAVLDVAGPTADMGNLARVLSALDAELVILRFDHRFFEDQVARVARQVIPRLRSIALPDALERVIDGPAPF